jgi:hypothetical protein
MLGHWSIVWFTYTNYSLLCVSFALSERAKETVLILPHHITNLDCHPTTWGNLIFYTSPGFDWIPQKPTTIGLS